MGRRRSQRRSCTTSVNSTLGNGCCYCYWRMWALVLLFLAVMGNHSDMTGASASRVNVQDRVRLELRRATAKYQNFMQPRQNPPPVDIPPEAESDGEFEDTEEEKPSDEILVDWDELTLNIKHPYRLGAHIQDWEEQRTSWLNRHYEVVPKGRRKPRVLIITGSQPTACLNPDGDQFHVKALKNKMDYARMHDMEFMYNFSFLDSQFKGVWTKLPIIRTLMLSHPEIEWFMWMDADAIFTDMLFEIPLHEYDNYNLVIQAWLYGFKKRDWVSVNDGVFLLRNCQWSLDLFDKWSPMGPEGETRDVAGEFLSTFLTNRRQNYPADDQSALMFVLLQDKEVLAKTKLIEREYKMHGYWVDVVNEYEGMMAKYHPGFGDCRWPFVTHFTGCAPCTGWNNPQYPLETCMRSFDRAYTFADNQVLAYMGYRHETLDSPDLVRTWNESARPLEHLGENPWREKIAEVLAAGEPPPECW